MIHSDSDSSDYSDEEEEDVSSASVQPATPTSTSTGSVPSTTLPPASPKNLVVHQRSDSRGSPSQLAPTQISEDRSVSPRSRSPSPSPGGTPHHRMRRSHLVSKDDLKMTPRGKRLSLEKEVQLGQEQLRDKRMLYVLVARCVAFPIGNRPKVDVTVRPMKLSKDRYMELLKRVRTFLAAEDATKTADEPDYLRQCLTLYHERILQSPQVTKLAEDGNISTAELKQLFAVFALRQADMQMKAAHKSEGRLVRQASMSVENTASIWTAEVDRACFADEVSSPLSVSLSLPFKCACLCTMACILYLCVRMCTLCSVPYSWMLSK